jgi:hypothetical protein
VRWWPKTGETAPRRKKDTEDDLVLEDDIDIEDDDDADVDIDDDDVLDDDDDTATPSRWTIWPTSQRMMTTADGV